MSRFGCPDRCFFSPLKSGLRGLLVFLSKTFIYESFSFWEIPPIIDVKHIFLLIQKNQAQNRQMNILIFNILRYLIGEIYFPDSICLPIKKGKPEQAF